VSKVYKTGPIKPMTLVESVSYLAKQRGVSDEEYAKTMHPRAYEAWCAERDKGREAVR
jgi:hypothetical protein